MEGLIKKLWLILLDSLSIVSLRSLLCTTGTLLVIDLSCRSPSVETNTQPSYHSCPSQSWEIYRFSVRREAAGLSSLTITSQLLLIILTRIETRQDTRQSIQFCGNVRLAKLDACRSHTLRIQWKHFTSVVFLIVWALECGFSSWRVKYIFLQRSHSPSFISRRNWITEILLEHHLRVLAPTLKTS